ncbi:SDR family NAD(P)-dependent oxidoreductase [Pseudomonas schmalbachii]|uniref:SDR family oxidoreductase n=1 Tax=Pseudomonas schmalbachii TaxID=2816993 RepID=A0ABS3TMX6_9PSED|nr:SDR family NAD(P)-dependent oxidoreductase [Pseudomonas schmalbachii]MBO3274020.1 SDR family oxidoreductase [Pseudomonas schmalbachii]
MIAFDGKTVLITGAASGIGRACARMLGRAGANLALADINEAALEVLQAELVADGVGGGISCHVLDIGDEESCIRTSEAVATRHGRIDHLIHAAGIYPREWVRDMQDADWQKVMRVNLDGTFYICRAVMPYLSDDSSIVNLSSVAGHRGSPSHAHYSASKGAVSSFSKSLALELAPRTRVNLVAPGIIETPMTTDLLQSKGKLLMDNTPMRRFGTAEEVAGCIVFLCSPLAGFVTGETVHVNGGLYMV